MALLRFWKSVVWALFVLVACVTPARNLQKVNRIPIPHFDKLVHFTLFFVLVLLLLYEGRQYLNSTKGRRTTLWIVIFSSAYAVALEAIQLWFVASRSGSLMDLLANWAGIVLAIATWRWLEKRRGNTTASP